MEWIDEIAGKKSMNGEKRGNREERKVKKKEEGREKIPRGEKEKRSYSLTPSHPRKEASHEGKEDQICRDLLS